MTVIDLYNNFCVKCPRLIITKYGEDYCGVFPISRTFRYNPFAQTQAVYWMENFKRPSDCNFNLEATLLENQGENK